MLLSHEPRRPFWGDSCTTLATQPNPSGAKKEIMHKEQTKSGGSAKGSKCLLAATHAAWLERVTVFIMPVLLSFWSSTYTLPP